MSECNQSGCVEPGAYRFTWPGRDEATICEKHVGKLRAVIDAMGLYVQIRPVELRSSPGGLASRPSEPAVRAESSPEEKEHADG